MANSIEPSIGALVVNWNRRDDLLECIESLKRSTYSRLSIYVVDNASHDGSRQAVADTHPDVRIIASSENLGFAAGNNLGIANLIDDGMDAAFLVNNDVVVAEDALEKMVCAGFEDDSIGVFAPKVLVHAQPDVIWSAGGSIESENAVAYQRCYGEKDDGRADEPALLDYAVGCAMLVKSDVIRQVGGMDTRYFMYYEEADWCRRIRRAGYDILYVPESRVWHKVDLVEDTGRNNVAYYMSRNRLLYLHMSGARSGKVAWIAVSDILRSAAAHAARGRTHESRLMLKAVVDYYTNSLGMLDGDKRSRCDGGAARIGCP